MPKEYGFETFEYTHLCRVFPVDGPPSNREKQEVQTPSTWRYTWWVHDHPTWTEPEASFMKVSTNPERVHEGTYSYRMFGPAGPIWGGLSTQAEATPGEAYKLSAFVHAWTNHFGADAIPGHEDCCGDPTCSWGAGREPFAKPFDELPELNGDAWNDALHAARFRVGIDPTGGMDPTADSVVWGQAWAVYNAFHQIKVIAEAESQTVTLFLEQKMRWAFRNNDGYWDSVVFEQINQEPEVECVPPAFNYSKVGLVKHPDASFGLGAALGISATHPNARRSDLFSLEDQCSGTLDNTAYLCAFPEEEKAAYAGYIEHYYPHVEFIFIDGASPTEIAVKALPPLSEDIAQAQNDPRWKDKHFGEDPREKIDLYGCYLTRFSILIRDVYDVDCRPDLLDQLFVNARVAYVSGNLIDWKGACELFERLTEPIRHNRRLEAVELKALLDDDYAITLRRSDGGHFVALERVEGEDLHIIDTWDGKRKVWSVDDYQGIRAAKVIPASEPGEPPTTPPIEVPDIYLGAQEQRPGEFRDEYIATVKPPVWMLIEGWGQAEHIKSLSPETKIIVRHVDNDWQSYLYADDIAAQGPRFIDRFRDSLLRNAPYIDYVVGLNEYLAVNDYRALRASGPWLESFCGELERMGYPARPIGFNQGVGNPQHTYICDEQGIERQIPLMFRGARALMYAKGANGYHAYFGNRPGFSTLTTTDEAGRPNAFHYSLRSLLSIDPEYVEAGIEIDHVFTEGGSIYYDPVHGMSNPAAGWRWPETLNGNIEAHIDQLLVFNQLIKDWNAENNGRFIGATLFLWAGYSGWRYFELEGEMGRRLADSLITIQG